MSVFVFGEDDDIEWEWGVVFPFHLQPVDFIDGEGVVQRPEGMVVDTKTGVVHERVDKDGFPVLTPLGRGILKRILVFKPPLTFCQLDGTPLIGPDGFLLYDDPDHPNNNPGDTPHAVHSARSV